MSGNKGYSGLNQEENEDFYGLTPTVTPVPERYPESFPRTGQTKSEQGWLEGKPRESWRSSKCTAGTESREQHSLWTLGP